MAGGAFVESRVNGRETHLCGERGLLLANHSERAGSSLPWRGEQIEALV